jgi:uncharacterized protein
VSRLAAGALDRQGARQGWRAARPLLVGLVLLVVVAPSAWAEKEVPVLAARVNDLADIIPAPARERLEGKLRELERRTGAQVAALTVDTLEGDSIEDYAVRVFQTWKLGRRGVDDGVLFVVARQERRMRIEVGYGLEDRLTDARSRQILDDIVRPLFRGGDFGAGIEAGIDAIATVIEGAPLPAPRRDPARQFGSTIGLVLFSAMFSVVIGTFSVIALLTPGAGGWFLYLFLIPFYAIFPSVLFPPYGGAVAAGAWVVLFPILRSVLHSPGGKNFRQRHGWIMAPGAGGRGGRWSSGGPSGGGGSSGGGGFSGGGGSSGGGGASSSW